MKDKEDQLRVAKLVIYGWTKDWSCLALYQAITSKPKMIDEDLQVLSEKYHFIPNHWFWYINPNRLVRQYIRDADKKLSDALWDTDDKIKRLSFAERLMSLDCRNVKQSSKFDRPDIYKNDSIRKKYRADTLAIGKHKEYAQKMNGTHWGTVK